LKFGDLPNETCWSEDSIFVFDWFDHDFFITLEEDFLKITKLPGPLIVSFESHEQCVEHLMKNHRFYFSRFEAKSFE